MSKQDHDNEISYHVFTDGRDIWFDSFEDAYKKFLEWCDLYENVRLYEDVQDLYGETIHEDCLHWQGSFPW